MSLICDLCKDVSDFLNGQFSDFVSVVKTVPRQDLQNVKALEVFVTPESCMQDKATRGDWMIHPTINVGVIKNISPLTKESVISELITLNERITNLLKTTGFKVGNVTLTPVRVGDNPLYNFEHILQFSCFTSVITIEYIGSI